MASTLSLAQDILKSGTIEQRETLAKMLEGERGVEALRLVSAHDQAENLHDHARLLPQGQDRDERLVISTQAMSHAADLQRAYAVKYFGGHTLDGREMGESRADYQSASSSFATKKKMQALEDARRIVRVIWES